MIAPSSRRAIAGSEDDNVSATRALRVIFSLLAAAPGDLSTAARRSAARSRGAARGRVRATAVAAIVLCAAVGYVQVNLAIELALPLPTGTPLLFAAGMAVRGDPADDIEDLTETVERLDDGEYDVEATTDRDDAVGRLYEAVDDLASTLRERDRRREQSERYRRELYQITSDAELDREEKIRRLLELGCERFDVENGLIARIDEETDGYEIETAVGGDFVEAGEVTGLSETFCRNTVTSDDILGIYDAAATGWEDDPGYREWNIGCYLGGKITVEDELYGTLCFVDPDPRGEPFTHEEKAFADLMTRWVSYEFERRRRRRELRLKDRAMEAAPVGITLTDPSREDNPLVYVNEEFERVTGYSREEAIGRNCRFLQGPETEAEPVAAMREAVDAAEPVSVELRNYRKDGTQFWNRVSIAPVRDEEGDVARFVGFQEDVTARRERERELERQTSLIDSVFEQLPIYLYVKDEEGRHVRTSPPPFVDEYPEDEEWFRGKTDFDIFSEEFASETYADDMRVIEEGESVVNRVEYNPEEDIWLLTSKVPWRDGDGDIRGLIGVTQSIDEQKKRERELRETNERLGAIIEASPAAIVAFDPDGRVELWNPAAEEIFGWSEAELLGEPLPIVPEDRADEFERLRDRLLDGESVTGVETRRRRKDGELIDVNLSAAPLRDDDGEVVGIMGALEDITERKRLESELREVLGRVTDAFYALDDDWNFEFVNERARELMAPDEPELVGRTIWEVFPGREDTTMGREFRRAMDEQTPVSFEEYSERLDAWFDIRAYPSETGLSVYFRDVTDRKERERQLERTTARLEALFENSPDMIEVLDPEGRIVEVNRRFCEKLGYDEEELVGEGIWEYERLFDAEEVRAVLDEMAVGDRRRFEGRFERRDGSAFPIEVHIIRLDLSGGDQFVAICRDITERKERERDLELYETIVQAVGDPVYAFDESGEFMIVNDAIEQVAGHDPDELIGEPASTVMTDEDLERARDLIRDLLTGGDDYAQFEMDLVTADGDTIAAESNMALLPPTDGEFAGTAGVTRDITERKERERELRETNERLGAIIEASPAALIASDLEGNVDLWNPAAERIFGWSEDEVLGTRLPIVPDDRIEEFEELRDRLDDGETVTGMETKRQRKDGELIDVSLSAAPMRDSEGEAVGVIAALQDITERKERERELRETKRRLDLALEGTNTGIWEWNIETDEVVWNETLERIVGLEPDGFEGTVEAFRRRVHPDDRERVVAEIEDAVESGEFYQTEFRMRRADGETIWVEARGQLVENGERMLGTHHDITDRKEAEQKLRERERALERYREYTDDVLDAVDDVFYVLDEDGDTQRWNESLSDVTGYSDAEIGRMNAVEFFPADHRDRVAAAIEEASETGDARVEAPFQTKDGEIVPYEFVASALEDPDGNPVVAGIGRDVTERVEYERELERIRHLLEQSQRLARVGAWEIEVDDGEPTGLSATDEAYRIYGLSPDADLSLEDALERYPPEDEGRIRDGVERAIRDGEGYDHEVRLITAAGDQRWVRAIADPVREGGEIVAVRGSIQDITDRKEREIALESLHDAAQDLLTTETEGDAADLVVETAADILDVDGVGIYLLDSATNRLEPAASAGVFVDDGELPPSVAAGDSDSLLWNCYVTGTPTVFDEAEPVDRPGTLAADLEGGLLVPIGDHGVFVVATSGAAIDDELRRLVETLVATAEAALDRIESEASLRERDAELESRNRRLEQQIRINEIIRTIGQSLVGATSQDEIERTVCDRLAESEDVSFAWIGDFGPGGDELAPRSWAGTDPEYLDAVSLDAAEGSAEPSVAAARSEEPAVVPNVLDRLKAESWRKSALAHDFNSVLSVPLKYGDYVYGVLSVYAAEPEYFGDLERTVFRELGESIANSINAVNTRQALHADTSLELTLRMEDGEALLLRIARELGCRVEYEGIGAQSPDETGLFFTTRGADPDDVLSLLGDLVSVGSSRLISSSEDGHLFEATVSGGAIAPQLVRHGASPQSMRADEDGMEIVVRASTTTDVREFVEMLQDQFPSVELAGRRNVQRATHTRQELVGSLLEELTDRQLEVLRTAYFAGFFEWPRESTGEEVAAMLGVSQPTINRHLRVGQQRLLAQLFEREREVEAG